MCSQWIGTKMKMHRKTPYSILTIYFLIFTAGCHSTDNSHVRFKTSGPIGSESSANNHPNRLYKRNIPPSNNNLINKEFYDYVKANGRPTRMFSVYDLIMKSINDPEIHTAEEGLFYSKWRDPANEPIEFINNIDIRGNEELAPAWPSRGRRSEHYNSSRARREEDGELFWGNRGRRSEDSDVFWGNRGKKNDEDQFWGTRGKKASDTDPFWGNRGKKNDEDQFWGTRGKKSDDPFWGNRGKRNKLKQWEKMLKNYEILNQRNFQKSANRHYLTNEPIHHGLKLIPERRSDDEQFWGMRGKRGRYNVLDKKDEIDPFWGMRGKRFNKQLTYDPEYDVFFEKRNDEDPFWGNRGKRFRKLLTNYENQMRNAEKKNEDDPFWGNRGKRDIPFIDGEALEDLFEGNFDKDAQTKNNADDENFLINYITMKPKNNKFHLKTIKDETPQGTMIVNIIPRNKTGNELITQEDDPTNNREIPDEDESDLIYRAGSKEIPNRIKRDLGSFEKEIVNQPNVINNKDDDEVKTKINNKMNGRYDVESDHDITFMNNDGNNPLIRFTPNDKFDLDLINVYVRTHDGKLKNFAETEAYNTNNDKIMNAHQNV